MKWRTKDNKIIDIKDMSDSHLNNTIKWLEKIEKEKFKNTFDFDYLSPQGEGATSEFYKIRTYNERLLNSVYEYINMLKKEKTRRKVVANK